MKAIWDDDGSHAKCGPYHINLKVSADGGVRWNAAIPSYVGWQCDGAFATKNAARDNAENWLRQQAKQIIKDLRDKP